MEIHQLLVSASPGDAITNAALELRALLRRVGPSEIFARYYDPSLAGDVLPLTRYAKGRTPHPEDNVLLFHASIGEPELFSFMCERPERLVLMYHNISPPEPFQPYDPAFAGLLEAGRRELAQLRDRVTMALADSPFNARELERAGYRDVRVSPLIVDVAHLREVVPDQATTHHLETQVEGPVLLFVGQLLPHKRPDLLVKAYHTLVTYLLPEAHLVVVGAGRLPRYRQALQIFVHELNLARAWLAGPVTLAQLVAFYRRADAFVTASEHEGFCVPLLEAMAFDVPVVARAHAAIPETLSGAGLVLPADEDPLLMAEAMAAVLQEGDLRESLVRRGRSRLGDFDPERAREVVLGHLLDVA